MRTNLNNPQSIPKSPPENAQQIPIAVSPSSAAQSSSAPQTQEASSSRQPGPHVLLPIESDCGNREFTAIQLANLPEIESGTVNTAPKNAIDLRCYQFVEKHNRNCQAWDITAHKLGKVYSNAHQDLKAVTLKLSKIDKDTVSPEEKQVISALENLSQGLEEHEDLKDKGLTYLQAYSKAAEENKSLWKYRRTQFFSKSFTATLLRAGLQSLFVTGIGSAMQGLTIVALKSLYENNKELLPTSALLKSLQDIPETEPLTTSLSSIFQGDITTSDTTNAPILPLEIEEAAVTELMKRPPEDILALAAIDTLPDEDCDTFLSGENIKSIIDKALVPGSAYIDASSSTAGETIGTDAAASIGKGVMAAFIDNKSQQNKRELAVSDIKSRVGHEKEKQEITASNPWSRMGTTLKKTGKDNVIGAATVWGVLSGVTVGSGIAQGKKFGKIAEGIGTNLLFTTLNAAITIGIDVLRTGPACLNDLRGMKEQGLKFALRVLGRAAFQMTKRAISEGIESGEAKSEGRKNAYGPMCSSDKMAGTPTSTLFVKDGLAVLGGAFKDLTGAWVQTQVAAKLPPHEKWHEKIGTVADKALKLRGTLSDLKQHNGGNLPAQYAQLDTIVEQYAQNIKEAMKINRQSPDLDQQWQDYQQDIKTYNSLTGITVNQATQDNPTPPSMLNNLREEVAQTVEAAPASLAKIKENFASRARQPDPRYELQGVTVSYGPEQPPPHVAIDIDEEEQTTQPTRITTQAEIHANPQEETNV